MIGINQMTLVGNVGTKPEIKYSSAGKAIINLSVATTDTWVDKETGEKKQATEWHRVSMFGKLAEIANQYVEKGSKVFIQGKLKTRSYEQDGVKKYTTEIVVSGFQGIFQLLDKRDDSNVVVVSPVVDSEPSQQDARGDIPF